MNLTEICCSVNDIKDIQKWWEAPISPLEPYTESRNTIRKRKLHNVSNYTKEILRRHTTLTKFATDLTMNRATDAYCHSSASNFLAFDIDAQNLLQKFTEESTRCWEFTNELQVSLMCSACDHKAQKFLDFQKSEVLINQESFRKFSNQCKKMVLLNTEKLFPYYEKVEKLSKCSQTGQFSASKKNLNLYNEDIYAHPPKSPKLAQESAGKLISFGTKININSEGSEKYLTLLLGNIKEMLGESMPDLMKGLSFPQKQEGVSDKVLFTAFEIKEKLNNFIKSLQEEGKTSAQINKLLVTEKVDLANQMLEDQEFDFHGLSYFEGDLAYNITPRTRTLAASTSQNKTAPRRLAKKKKSEKKCDDVLSERIKGISDDMKKKFKEYTMAQFERTYPPTKKMYEGTDDDPADWNQEYKNSMAWSKDMEWRKYYHPALKHYLRCGDYDLFNTPELNDNKKWKKDERDRKANCKDKVELHSSINDFIDTIPYPGNKNRKVFDPEESDEDSSKDDTKATEKLIDCLEDKVLEKFDTLIDGIEIDAKDKCSYKKKDDKKLRRTLRRRERRLEKSASETWATPLSPHPNDKIIYMKIKKLKVKQQRKLAYRSAKPHEQSLSQLLDKCFDRNRMLSLLRYEEDDNLVKRRVKVRKLGSDSGLGSDAEDEAEENESAQDDAAHEAGNDRRLGKVKGIARKLAKSESEEDGDPEEEIRALLQSEDGEDDDDDDDDEDEDEDDKKRKLGEEENDDDDDDDDDDEDRVRRLAETNSTNNEEDLKEKAAKNKEDEKEADSVGDEEEDSDSSNDTTDGEGRRLGDNDEEQKDKTEKDTQDADKDKLDSDSADDTNTDEGLRRRLPEDKQASEDESADEEKKDKKTTSAEEEPSLIRRRLGSAQSESEKKEAEKEKEESQAEASDEEKPAEDAKSKKKPKRRSLQGDDESSEDVQESRRLLDLEHGSNVRNADASYLNEFLNKKRNRVLMARPSTDENMKFLGVGGELKLTIEDPAMRNMKIPLDLKVRVVRGGYDLAGLNEDEPSPIDIQRVDLSKIRSEKSTLGNFDDMMRMYGWSSSAGLGGMAGKALGALAGIFLCLLG